jgi:two-component system response regulator
MESSAIEILLIEDNPHEAELAIRSLKKHHLANRLIHIDDGAEAVDFLFCRGKYEDTKGRVAPKLILLDLKLPKVSGHEILKQIRADEQLKAVPVVVLTSSNEESDILESYKLGVNSYIVKPVNFESFSKSIAEMGMYWMVLNKIPSST